MTNILEYNGYRASIEFDAESDCFVGTVIGINDNIVFGGVSIAELKQKLKDSIDTYLELCKQKGIEPDREYSGRFNVRISPETHKKAALAAASKHITLNQYVSDVLDASVENVAT